MDDIDLAPSRNRDLVSEWLARIERARTDADYRKWDKRCELIRRRYRYEGSALVKSRRFQIFWSTIEALKSSIYSKPPKTDVSRRFNDPDPVARTAVEMLERSINFTFDIADFDDEFTMVVLDFLLYGRGVVRAYYEQEYEEFDDDAEGVDGEDVNGDKGIPADSRIAGMAGGRKTRSGKREKLKLENVRIRFIQRRDFIHEPARVWGEVSWGAFKSYLTRAELTKRWGAKIGKQIALDADALHPDDSARRSTGSVHNESSKATVWEIWDKSKNKVLWIAKGWPDVLEETDPYLVLDGFYPCPRPAYDTLTSDSLVPVPLYVYIKDQCEQIDQLTARIASLADALKLAGFYPGGPQGEGVPEIEKAMEPEFENKLIAVQAWSAFLEGGGGKGPPIVWMPVEQVMTILQGCVELRKQHVEDVFQITGISDVMRGATDPQETEGAQQLKAQFGGTRIKARQKEIARFCRDVGRIVGEIVVEYFQPETIEEMTNMTLPTEADLLQAKLAAMRAAAMQTAAPQMQPQGAGAPMA